MNNRKAKIILLVLLLSGGLSLGLGVFFNKKEEPSIVAKLDKATIEVTGSLDYKLKNNLKGHIEAKTIKVEATADNELVPYNLIWKGDNTLNASVSFRVYKTSKEVEVKASCKKKNNQEDCVIDNITKLGKPINEGTIKKDDKEIILAENEFINASLTGKSVYYYVVIEYTGNEGITGKLEGSLAVNKSEAKPNINILAAYKENDNGEYEETKTIPQTGYVINKEKSVCSNGAEPEWDKDNGGLLVTSLSKETSCYLYFDIIPSEKTLANLNLHPSDEEIGTITGPSCNNNSQCGNGKNMNQNGLYETEDDDGASYIFRGTVDNNWVKFGKKGNDDIWWRIIRINGNGSIRLIYAGEGTAPSGNGNNIESTGTKYNEQSSSNTYVGYYYGSTEGTDFTETHSNSTQSTIAKKTETWFSSETNLNAAAQLNHIDEDAGFCNNRQISSNPQQWWAGEGLENRGTSSVYTAYKGHYNAFQTDGNWRTDVNYASLRCSSDKENFEANVDYKRDYYTWKRKATRGNQALAYPIGLITMDEVILAGGFGGQNNTGYWLNSGTYYWTMSPRIGDSVSMFMVDRNGALQAPSANSATPGVRPVINLKANTKFEPSTNQGDWGTTGNPYIVSE